MSRRDFLWETAKYAKLAAGLIIGGTVAIIADVYSRTWPKGAAK